MIQLVKYTILLYLMYIYSIYIIDDIQPLTWQSAAAYHPWVYLSMLDTAFTKDIGWYTAAVSLSQDNRFKGITAALKSWLT
jgi:hypothetical protein